VRVDAVADRVYKDWFQTASPVFEAWLPDHKHLRRLETVWKPSPLYFVTTCVENRRPVLADAGVLSILRDEFIEAERRYGWRVGRFVVMPDHLHFFCISDEAVGSASLSRFVGGFKQWSAKLVLAEKHLPPPLWQKQFFDHLLRSNESYDSKWIYVRENPVRAGLVKSAEAWPFGGEISTIVR
jgi:putative transposase